MSRHGEKMKTKRTNNESKQLPAQQIHWLHITVWKTRRPAHNRIKWRNTSAEETFLCGVFAQNDSETTCMRCSTSWSWLAVGSADNMHPNHACEWFWTRACKTNIGGCAQVDGGRVCVVKIFVCQKLPTQNTTSYRAQFITPTQILVRRGLNTKTVGGPTKDCTFVLATCRCKTDQQPQGNPLFIM